MNKAKKGNDKLPSLEKVVKAHDKLYDKVNEVFDALIKQIETIDGVEKIDANMEEVSGYGHDSGSEYEYFLILFLKGKTTFSISLEKGKKEIRLYANDDEKSFTKLSDLIKFIENYKD